MAGDGDFADVRGRVRAAADGWNKGNLVPHPRLEAFVDIFLVDGEAYGVVMAAERGKFADQMPPDLADGCAVGKFARQLGSTRPLAKRREQFDRELVHWFIDSADKRCARARGAAASPSRAGTRRGNRESRPRTCHGALRQPRRSSSD